MGRTVIVSGVRTPFGKFGGELSHLKAVELGGLVIKEALFRAKLSPREIDECIVGMVLQGGQGQMPSRQAADLARLPWSVRTETLNKGCASGMRSITLGDQVIRANDAEVIVAAGMESMSQAPYFMSKARFGFGVGNGKVHDLMVHDGLTCPFSGIHIASYGNHAANKLNISREEQDQWAVCSHQKAIQAIRKDRLTDEITPVEVVDQKGNSKIIFNDELPRADVSVGQLAKLSPVYDRMGTITKGNIPEVSDGACAVVLMSEARAIAEGTDILGTIVGHTALSFEPKQSAMVAGHVIDELLQKTGKIVSEVDLFEINEMVAVEPLATQKMTGIDPQKINVNGGTVAFGHPLAASGARLILTLAYELKRRGGRIGVAAISSGSGQAEAVMIEV
ncbi:acetyl-CoA acetyltransferase [Anaerobacillus alkalilacustris]|uniref:acetyl-CoA C-acetyltransferase n=1 Tax=Anaerobacillus alkalilacustris TaxID=393763 RepID=A0A1S2LHR5_9BACI|nr:acetyl-CoA C-acetyltransferase [Anaerobacillus alkalilacustris]OIJ11770.1 acetyl-CoA acetyltransferase [Anaerobacillus alkalilacustris]